MTETPFAAEFRQLLSKHGIHAPKFAHGAVPFDPAKPRVLYSGPVFDQDELVAATAALCEGRWSVSGEIVNRFEKAFSQVVGQAETVAVNSGSSADLLMVAAAKKRYGWLTGDRVIVSPVGFPTSISAITLNGLVPVFVDIEWDTLNADSSLVEKALESSVAECKLNASVGFGEHPVRAILVSPVLGNPPDIDRLTALAARYGVTLLLDGCDSLGTTWRGSPLASYFVASTCSFYPAHHISTLNGGAISSNDTELIAIARSMSQWGRDCRCFSTANMSCDGVCGKRFSRWLPDVDCELDHRYVYSNVGFNLQMLDLQAAMGLEQLKKLPFIHGARRDAFERIKNLFLSHLHSSIAWSHAIIYDCSEVSWFGFSVTLRDPEIKRRLVAHLESRQIQTRSYFAGNLLAHEAYRHLGDASLYPNANEVLCRVFWLGVSPQYTEEHFAHIAQAVKDFTP